MAQGDKNKNLNKNKRAFVKPTKPKRGDQQALGKGRVFIPVKKADKVEQAQAVSTSIKKQYKFTEAVFANRVKGISGQSNDLQMKYAELTAKTTKKGHR